MFVTRVAEITRFKPFIPVATLKMLCNASVQPYFDRLLWDSCRIGLKTGCKK